MRAWSAVALLGLVAGCASFDPAFRAVPENASVSDAPYPRLADIPPVPPERVMLERAIATRAMLDEQGVAALSRSQAAAANAPVPEGFDAGARRAPDERPGPDRAALRGLSESAAGRRRGLPQAVVTEPITVPDRVLTEAPLTDSERMTLLSLAARTPREAGQIEAIPEDRLRAVRAVEALDPLVVERRALAPSPETLGPGAIRRRAIPDEPPVDADALLRAARAAAERARTIGEGL